MFSFISINWKGKPLVSYQTVVNLIGSTRTRTGLRLKAKLDTKTYHTGKKVTEAQMKSVQLQPHRTQPQWNYTLSASDAKSYRCTADKQ